MEDVKLTGRWMIFWVSLGAVIWVVLAWLVLGLAGCMYVSGEVTEEDTAKVTFLDVGQGLAVLLEFAGKYALYDAGPDSVGVLDSLRARGIDTLQWVVVSHYHRDHVGGLLELENPPRPGTALPAVKQLYVGLDSTRGFIRDSLFRQVRRLGIPVDSICRGSEITLGELRLKVLWPPEFMALGGNESSVVLEGHLDSSTESFLLTGDLDSACERRLLELSPSLKTTLLQVPHHGSSGSSSLNFLSRLSPRYAAISVGVKNDYGHPTESVLRKLGVVVGDTNAIYRTDLDGSVSFQIIPGVGVVH